MRGHKVLPSQSKYFPTESENFPIRADLPEGPQGMEYCTPKCNPGCFKINQSYTTQINLINLIILVLWRIDHIARVAQNWSYLIMIPQRIYSGSLILMWVILNYDSPINTYINHMLYEYLGFLRVDVDDKTQFQINCRHIQTNRNQCTIINSLLH